MHKEYISKFAEINISKSSLQEAFGKTECNLAILYERCLKLQCWKFNFDQNPWQLVILMGDLSLIEKLDIRKLISIEDSVDISILHLATMSRSLDTLKYILDHYPRNLLAFRADRFDINILHYAAFSGSTDIFNYVYSCFPQLLKSKSRNYRGVLEYAMMSGVIEMLDLVSETFTKSKLMPRKAPLRRRKMQSFYDAARSNLEMYEHCIKSHPNAEQIQGLLHETALFYAALTPNTEALIKKIDEPKDLNSSDIGKKEKCLSQLLEGASESGWFENIRLIIEKIASHLKDKDDEPLDITIDKTIKRYKNTIVLGAAFSGNLPCLQIILRHLTHEEAAKAGDYLDRNILHKAAESGSLKTFSYVFENFPELRESKDKFGYCLLNLATWSGSIILLKHTLEPPFKLYPHDFISEKFKTTICIDAAYKRSSILNFRYIMKKWPELAHQSTSQKLTILDMLAESGSDEKLNFFLLEHPYEAAYLWPKKRLFKHNKADVFYETSQPIEATLNTLLNCTITTLKLDKKLSPQQTDLIIAFFDQWKANIPLDEKKLCATRLLKQLPLLDEYSLINDLKILKRVSQLSQQIPNTFCMSLFTRNHHSSYFKDFLVLIKNLEKNNAGESEISSNNGSLQLISLFLDPYLRTPSDLGKIDSIIFENLLNLVECKYQTINPNHGAAPMITKV